MINSFVNLLPDIELGRVSYRPNVLAEDLTSPPMVYIELGIIGSGLSLTIEDARVLLVGLRDALAEHDGERVVDGVDPVRAVSR